MIYSDTRPWLPGLVRGFLLAVVGAAIAFVADNQTNQDLPAGIIAMTPLVLLFGRTIEALILDQFRDKDERMTPDI